MGNEPSNSLPSNERSGDPSRAAKGFGDYAAAPKRSNLIASLKTIAALSYRALEFQRTACRDPCGRSALASQVWKH
jgi:hypothetical protein